MTNTQRSISKATLARLPEYVRALRALRDAGIDSVSSGILSSRSGISPDVVRRDLWDLQVGGKRGVGYNVSELLDLLVARPNNTTTAIAIVGVGNIGNAVANYTNLSRSGFRLAALFDNDEEKLGRLVASVRIQSAKQISATVRAAKVEIGVLATPSSSAQAAADDLCAGGVRGILNFAPVKIDVPTNVKIRQVDLMGELEVLNFLTSEREQ